MQEDQITDKTDIQERLINATPKTVFEALSNPDLLARWWGPKGFSSKIHEFDFKVGGDCHLTMHGPDGKDYPNLYRFLEIEKNQKIVIEHLGEPHHFVLTIKLTPKDQATAISWRQEFDTVEHYQEIAEFVAIANQQNLKRMESIVSHLNK